MEQNPTAMHAPSQAPQACSLAGKLTMLTPRTPGHAVTGRPYHYNTQLDQVTECTLPPHKTRTARTTRCCLSNNIRNPSCHQTVQAAVATRRKPLQKTSNKHNSITKVNGFPALLINLTPRPLMKPPHFCKLPACIPCGFDGRLAIRSARPLVRHRCRHSSWCYRGCWWQRWWRRHSSSRRWLRWVTALQRCQHKLECGPAQRVEDGGK